MDIQVELEDISSVKKKLKIEVPAELASREFNEVADQYKRRARLPGFRPGKAPVSLVKRRFSKDIRSDVLQKLIPSSYEEAVRHKGVQPLSQPTMENLRFDEGEPLVYEALFEILPTMSLPQYRGLQVRVEERRVTQDDIDHEIERLRDKHARLLSVEDRGVQKDDLAIVDLEGEYLDESSRAPIREKNVSIQVGDEHTHKAFNEALLDMIVGQQKTFVVEYPPDYPEKSLVGQRVSYRLKVAEIKRKELPHLNDDFARDLGECDTLEALSTKIREQLVSHRQNTREADLRKSLMEQLIEKTNFEVPEVLVESRLDDKLKDLAYNIAIQGVDPSKANIDWAKVRADSQPEAEKEVRASLVLGEIARQEKVKVSNQELEEELGQIAVSTNQPEEKVRQHFGQENRMEGLRRRVERERALDLLVANADLRTT